MAGGFGGGATIAAARVVLGVDSAQFSEGLRAAEVEFASTVGQMGGLTAELYERQIRAGNAAKYLGSRIKQYGAESMQASEATAALVREQRRLADVQAEAALTANKFGSGLRVNQAHVRGFGAAMGFTTNALIGGAGLVYGLKIAIDASTKFQQQMKLIQTQALATPKEVVHQTANVLRVTKELATTPDQLSKGLYRIESAGIRSSHALKVLKTAAMGARIGMADLEDTTNALVAVQKTHIEGSKNLSQAMGTLDAIVGAGNMRMQDLAQALASGVVPAAKQFGLSLSQLGGALDVLTVQGVPAELAATRLRYTIALLGASTPKAAKQLETIGLSSIKVATIMKNQGLLPALELLKQKLDESGMSVERQNEILVRAYGGGRSSTTILTLLQNLQMLDDKTREIANKGTAEKFHARWLAQVATAQYKFDQLRAVIQKTEIQMGNALLPGAEKAASAVSGWLDKATNQQRLKHDVAEGFRDAADAANVLGTAIHDLGQLFHGLDSVIPGNLLKQLLEVFLLFKAAKFVKGPLTTALVNPMKSLAGATKDAATELKALQDQATRGMGSANAAIDSLAAGRGIAGYGRQRPVMQSPFPVSGGAPGAALAADEQASIRQQAASEMPLVWQRRQRELELQQELQDKKAEQAKRVQSEKDLSAAKKLETKRNNEETQLQNSRARLAKANGVPLPLSNVVPIRQAASQEVTESYEKEAVVAKDTAEVKTKADAQVVASTEKAVAVEVELADARTAGVAATAEAAAFSAAQVKQAQQLMLATGKTSGSLLQERMGLSSAQGKALSKQVMESQWGALNGTTIAARRDFEKQIGKAMQASWAEGNVPVAITRSGKRHQLNPFAAAGKDLTLMGGGKIPAEDVVQVQGGEYVLYDAANSPRENLLTKARQAKLAGGSASALDVSKLQAQDPLLMQAAIAQTAYGGASIESLQSGLGLSYAKAKQVMSTLKSRGVVASAPQEWMLTPQGREKFLTQGMSREQIAGLDLAGMPPRQLQMLEKQGLVSQTSGYRMTPGYDVSSIPRYSQIEEYAKHGGLLSPKTIASAFGLSDQAAVLAMQQMKLRGVIEPNPKAGTAMHMTADEIDALSAGSGESSAAYKDLLAQGVSKTDAQRVLRRTYGLGDLGVQPPYRVVSGSDLVPGPQTAEEELQARRREELTKRLVKGGMSPEEARAQVMYSENVARRSGILGPAGGRRAGSVGGGPGGISGSLFAGRPQSYADAARGADVARRAVETAKDRVAAAERIAAAAPPMPAMPSASSPEAQAARERLMWRADENGVLRPSGVTKAQASRIIKTAYGKTSSDELVRQQMQAKQRMEEIWSQTNGQPSPAKQAEIDRLDQVHREAGLALNERQTMERDYTAGVKAAQGPGDALAYEKNRLQRLIRIRNRRYAGAGRLASGPQQAQLEREIEAERARSLNEGGAGQGPVITREQAMANLYPNGLPTQLPTRKTAGRAGRVPADAEAASTKAIEARATADKAVLAAQKKTEKAEDLRAKATQTGSQLVAKQNEIQQGITKREKATQDKLTTKARRAAGVPTPAQLKSLQAQEQSLTRLAVKQDKAALSAEATAKTFQDEANAMQRNAAEAEAGATAAVKTRASNEQLTQQMIEEEAATKAQAEADVQARTEKVALVEQQLKEGVQTDRLTAAQQKLRTEMQLATKAAAKFAATEAETAAQVVKLNKELVEQEGMAIAASKGITEADDSLRLLTEDEIAAGRAARQEGRTLGATTFSPLSANSGAIRDKYGEGNFHAALTGGASQSGAFGFLPWRRSKGGFVHQTGSIESEIRRLQGLANEEGVVMSRTQALDKMLAAGFFTSLEGRTGKTGEQIMAPNLAREEQAGMFAGMRGRLGRFGGRLGGSMDMNSSMGLGMLMTMFGGQLPGIGGMAAGAGAGMMFAPMLSQSKYAGPAGALIGASFGARSMIAGSHPGTGRSLLAGGAQGALMGAGAGMMLGSKIGMFAGPEGALLGAGIGAGASLAISGLKMLFHSSDDTSKKLLGLAAAADHAKMSASQAHAALQAGRVNLANDKVNVDQYRAALKAAQKQERATRGEADKHRVAMDGLRAAEQNLSAAQRQVTQDEKGNTAAKQRQETETKKSADAQTKLAKNIAGVSKGFEHMVVPMGRFGAQAATQAQKVQAYASRMDDLGDKAQKSNPKLARTYHQLANIARETNKLPKNVHYIRVVLKLGVEGTKQFKEGLAMVSKYYAKAFPIFFGKGSALGDVTSGRAGGVHYDARTGQWVDREGHPIKNQQAAWDEWLKKHPGAPQPHGGATEPMPPHAQGGGHHPPTVHGQGYVDPASSSKLQQIQSRIDQIQAGLIHGNVKKLEQEELAWLRQDYKRARTSAERDAIAQAISSIKSQMQAATSNSISNGGIGLIPQSLQDRYNKAYQHHDKKAELAALEAEQKFLVRLAAHTTGAKHHKAEQLLNVIVGKIERLTGVAAGTTASLAPLKDQLGVQKAIARMYQQQHHGHGNVHALEQKRDLLLEYLKEGGHTRKQREAAEKELHKIQKDIRSAKAGGSDAILGVIKALQKEAADLDKIAHNRNKSLKTREKALAEENKVRAQIAKYQKQAFGVAGGDFLTSPKDMKEWLKLENRYAKAQQTKTKKDDIAALKAEQAFLQRARDHLHGKALLEANKLLAKIDTKLQKLIDVSLQTQKDLEQTYLTDLASFFASFGSNVFTTGANGQNYPGSQGAGGGHDGTVDPGYVGTPPPPPTGPPGTYNAPRSDGGGGVTIVQNFPPGTEDQADRHATYARVAAQSQFD